MKKQIVKTTAAGVILALALMACKGKTEKEEAQADICRVSGKEISCTLSADFEKASDLVGNLKTYRPSTMPYQRVLAYNDSILKLLPPYEEAMDAVRQLDASHADLYLGDIEKVKTKMTEWRQKANILENVKVKATISNPKSRGEKFVDFELENKSEHAFEYLTVITTYYDKEGNVVFTDDSDALGTTGFLPALSSDKFPGGYSGKALKSYILGPDESLHPKIHSLKQEIVDVAL